MREDKQYTEREPKSVSINKNQQFRNVFQSLETRKRSFYFEKFDSFRGIYLMFRFGKRIVGFMTPKPLQLL